MMNTGSTDGISLQILGQDGNTFGLPISWRIPRDETAAKYKHAVPPWHIYSVAGDAAGRIVYANYGAKEDYDKLEAMDVGLTGKIVLARYGVNYRGIKIKGVEEHGVVWILICSDPRDDGSMVVKSGYLPTPLDLHATRHQLGVILPNTCQFTQVIPLPLVIPHMKMQLLRVETYLASPAYHSPGLMQDICELGGVTEGRKFDGKIGTHVVGMTNDGAYPGWLLFPVKSKTKLPGLPQRRLEATSNSCHASWDAEKYGLIGSTEWGEDFAQWIQSHAIAYINVDIVISGSRYSASGSPSLAHLIKRSALDVAHPTEPGKTVWDALHDSGPYSDE